MRVSLRPPLWAPLGILLTGCSALYPPLEVVESVDLARYTGTWYEIASFPAPFQAGCTGTTAEYTLRDDGTVQVVNTCNLRSLDGPVDRIEGTARVPDAAEPAKLKVRFFPAFEADYWIIDLDPEYRYAVVGEPGRRFLWILSREPVLDEALYEQALNRAAEKGFDTSRLVRTLQPSADG